MRRTTHRREMPQSNETGGFRFAVTLLVALGTIVYVGYNYVRQTPLDINSYVFFCVLIPPALMLVICLLFYVLFKGYSVEVPDSKQKNQRNRLNDLSSNIYRMSLSMFAMLFIFMLYVTTLVLVSPKIENFTEWCTLFLIIIGIVPSLVVYWLLNKNIKSRLKQKGVWINYITPGATVLLLSMLFWLAVFPSVVDFTPLQGHVTVDMESISYKNDTPIPVLIHVTGPNTGLSICLVKEESNHNLEGIDKIKYLEPERNTTKTVSGENSTLVGNALNYGTYNVFINTTNLSAGYYELVCKRPKYEKTYGARGFYLLNSS
jgi:hypothetical protein